MRSSPSTLNPIRSLLTFSSISAAILLYGNGRVKEAYRNPKFFYQQLDINFKKEKPLEMKVTTPTGMILEPARKKDYKAYRRFFGDAKTMALYLNGAETEEKTAKRLEMYEDRVLKGYPWTGWSISVYNSMVVTCLIGALGPHLFNQLIELSPIKPSITTIGNIAAGNGDIPKEVQLGLVIGANIDGRNYQNQSYGTIVALAIGGIILFNLDRDIHVTVNDVTAPVTTLGATAHKKNILAQKLLEKMGFKMDPTRKPTDPERDFWSLTVAEMRKLHNEMISSVETRPNSTTNSSVCSIITPMNSALQALSITSTPSKPPPPSLEDDKETHSVEVSI